MNTLSLLLISLIVVSFNAFGADDESKQHKGERKADFYPKKPADKSLSTRPAKVDILEPKSFSTVTGGKTTVKWRASEGAESYRVQVATDPNFKWLIVNQDFVQATSLDVSGLEAGQQYFVRIYGMKTQNETGFSSSFPTVTSFQAK